MSEPNQLYVDEFLRFLSAVYAFAHSTDQWQIGLLRSRFAPDEELSAADLDAWIADAQLEADVLIHAAASSVRTSAEVRAIEEGVTIDIDERMRRTATAFRDVATVLSNIADLLDAGWTVPDED